MADTSPPPTPRAGVTRPRQRVVTPTMLQLEAVESGAAALGMVLGSLGRFVTLEELRLECGVSRDGSKAENLVRAARKYGLEGTIVRCEPDDLRGLAFPVILFWNFNHFVVLEGFKRETAYLNDPATGSRLATTAELDASFTGLAITFTVTPAFQRGGSPPRLLPALRRRLRGSETALLFAVLTGVALVIPGLAIPTFTRIFVDEVLVNQLNDWLRPLLLGMAITTALRALLTWLQERCLLRLKAKMAISTSGIYFSHVLRLPIAFFTQRWPGEIGTRVQINDDVAAVLSGDAARTCISLITVLFYAAVMLSYDPLMTAMTVGLAAVNVVALRLVSERRSESNEKAVRAGGQVDGASMGGLQMMESLKGTGTEDEFFGSWCGRYVKWLNAENELSVYTVYLMAVPPLLSTLNTVAILLIGGMRVMDGRLTIGMLVAFQSLSESFMEPVTELTDLGSTLQNVRGDIARLDDALRYPSDPQVPTITTALAPTRVVRLKGHVELRDVTFGYSRVDPPLIEGLSLTIHPGSRVALVGGSGSGKSTVARLVCGLYEPWSGDVLFDGRPRRETAPAVLNNSIGVVDQEIFLFAGPLRSNLTLWDTTTPEASLVRAAKDARVHEDIVLRSGGYDTLLEEGGQNFSGGQRQRLEIARALVNDPSILVLDEATSALDAHTEKIIDDHLRRRGCSCLIVAHRLSAIRDADEIVVLDRGRVVERGTHEQLIASDGHYAQLIQS
ncbi:MAG: NHLP family bacteriocin export ABC transporter peptidase/permease/ATPase subunit [Acidobacteriota bacterium]